MKTPYERRKCLRFRVLNPAFVVTSRTRGETGRLIDISSHGLAFKYVDDNGSLGGLSQLDIFLADHPFYLGRLPVKTVEDHIMSDVVSLNARTWRRRGVEFGALTDEQRSRLEYFVQHHTTWKKMQLAGLPLQKPTRA
ncbi:MAG: PilZ domain-containing protein [Thermodesulfobacteriota bacterium]|nr:PilZ domain-containing protein [Thermodesulfobacteriota bacterium]